MITTLSLKNFKAFDEAELEFGLLNILSGLNNSGKSSVIQSLRILNEQRPLPDLGSLGLYKRSDSKSFSIMCKQKINSNLETIFFEFYGDSNMPVKQNSKQNFIKGIVSYISADRLGPRNSLPLNIDDTIEIVGSKGENIVGFLSRLGKDWDDLQVPEKLIAKEGTGVTENIKEWLRFISPGIDFKYASDYHTDIGRTEFNGHRPVHVGFGLSYTLPIIASVIIHASQLLAGKSEAVSLLLENPEAHLHPSGQTKMGEMLALAASCGVQVIVETHSDHLLNGIRIAVKNKKISHTDVKCFFFKSGNWDGINEEPATVESIEIDEHGMVDYWPDGFFDETEKSLQRLI
jgi:predicted ATPase